MDELETQLLRQMHPEGIADTDEHGLDSSQNISVLPNSMGMQ